MPKPTTKLRNLKITKVDFVDEGANQDAHITLFKRKDDGGENMNMNVFEKIGKAIADALGIKPEDIEKSASTFNDTKGKMKAQQVFDRVWWDYQDALRNSITSILTDAVLDETGKDAMLKKTLEEFANTVYQTLTNAAVMLDITKSRDTDGQLERLEKAKSDIDAVIEAIQKEAGDDDDDDDDLEDIDDEEIDDEGVKKNHTKKEGVEDMNIDKSKMTPGELAVFEELVKKCSVEGGEDVNKNKPAEIHPDVKAELESLKKFKEDAEMKELVGIAKKYEVLGKKPEELATKLAELKKSGSYNDFIAILDEQVALVEKSGMFNEIGKKNGEPVEAWEQIEKHADEIMKSSPNLTRAMAIDKACEQHPELVSEYEKSRK